MVDKAGPESCAGLVVGVVGAFPLVVDLGLGPLVGRVMSRYLFRGVCGLMKTLGSLSADQLGCVPVMSVFGLRHSTIAAYRLLGGPVLDTKSLASRRTHANEYFPIPLISVSLSPQ